MTKEKFHKLQSIIGLLSLASFIYGFFAGQTVVAIVGGIILILQDLIAIWLGILKPAVPIILAVILALLIRPWYFGVFWSSTVFQIFNVPLYLKILFTRANKQEQDQNGHTQPINQVAKISDITIPLEVNRTEFHLIEMCIEHLMAHVHETKNDEGILSLRKKLNAAKQRADSPYDANLSLTVDEAYKLDGALHIFMTDSTIARQFGSMADERIGDTYISKLAEFAPVMNEILRRLHQNKIIATQEQQIAVLKSRMEQLDN